MTRDWVGKVCLALPGATLDHPFDADHDAYRVGGKMFVVVGSMGGVSFKASDIAFQVLTETGRARPAPYMARSKWVNIPDLADPGDWTEDDLADHFRIAHGIVASGLTKKARTALGLV